MPFDLGLASNWRQVFTRSVAVDVVSNDPTKHYALKDIEVNVASNYVYTFATSSSAKPDWYVGTIAKLTRRVTLGTSTVIYNANWSEEFVCSLNKLTLLNFPDYAQNSYTVNFSFPHWLKQITLTTWEYIGDPAPYSATQIKKNNKPF